MIAMFSSLIVIYSVTRVPRHLATSESVVCHSYSSSTLNFFLFNSIVKLVLERLFIGKCIKIWRRPLCHLNLHPLLTPPPRMRQNLGV